METLEHLTETFDGLLEDNYPHDFDVSFSVSQFVINSSKNLHK